MKTINVKIHETLEHDRGDVIKFLNGYDFATRPYDGDYTAEWLLSDIDSPEWIIKKSNTVKASEAVRSSTGQLYKYTETVIWEKLLPDGTYLTDPNNSYFLFQLQKLIFLIAEDPVNQQRMASNRIKGFASAVINFVSWVFLHKHRFQPSKYGLSKVSDSDLELYCKEMINGGVFHALAVGQRILSKIGLTLSNDRNPCFLELSESTMVEIFFRKNNFYKLNLRGIEIIDRSKIISFFKVAKQELMSNEASLFLRQFEPELLKINNKVLLPANCSTDYPTHNTPLIKSFLNRQYSSYYAFTFLKLYETGFQYEQCSKGFLKNAETFSLSGIKATLKRNAAPKKHTPWIPLKDNLLLLNKSIGMIINHANDIVRAYKNIMEELYKLEMLHRKRNDGGKTEIILEFLPNSLSEFNVVSYSHSDDAYKNCKHENKLSFVDLIELLQASCLIMIAGLKPIRIEELSQLQYDCLYYQEGDGYWLEQSLKKSGINDILPETAKPIPQITARAIKILRQFNDIAKKWGDKVSVKESNYLLYRLNIGNANTKGSVMDKEKIGQVLSVFCDYFGTSVDEYGRRWYVNIHELRKSFLLTFFWTFKNSSIDACQWIAGHKDPLHILDYIESNIPGSEMTDLEVEYARQQMTYFYEKSSLLEMQNTEELYQLVCDHFKVKEYTAIDADELQDYLEILLMKGTYKIEFISMGDNLNLIGNTQVAFKVIKNNE